MCRSPGAQQDDLAIACDITDPAAVTAAFADLGSVDVLVNSAAAYPGGRLPEVEDVAQLVAFFADPSSRFVNGQMLILDGGRSVGLSPG
jgi:NAD(P)-dependent dehydrogenase (short-subunit alcohol dehydrogenase family)